MANDTLVLEVISDLSTRKVTFTGIKAAPHLERYARRMQAKGYGVRLTDESYDSVLFDSVLQQFFFPTCEHGLSLSLCDGPQHYPFDADELAFA